MKTMIEVGVNNHDEAKAIRRALTDPTFKATAIVLGVLGKVTREEAGEVLRQVRGHFGIQ